MNVLILAGGRGTRMGARTANLPKALVAIGDRPILWHVMHGFAAQGFTRIRVAAGHLAPMITDYCASLQEPWDVDVVDTGPDRPSAHRLRDTLPASWDEAFIVSYCDSLCDLDVPALAAAHRTAGTPVTLCAVQPPPRFGQVGIDGDRVSRFLEKRHAEDYWINGGYFVVSPAIARDLGDATPSWEYDCLPALAARGALGAYRHRGFWQCMDDACDHDRLQHLAGQPVPPWTINPLMKAHA